MFLYLRRRFFAAKIMAELKAQINDQELIIILFSRDWTFKCLEKLRTTSSYRAEVHAPFIHGCAVLAEGVKDEGLDLKYRETCLSALGDRIRKAQSNFSYWHQYKSIINEISSDAKIQNSS